MELGNCTSLGNRAWKRHFPVGHRAWVDRQVAAPVGKGAKKAGVQCCDGHLWRKRGSCGPCDPAGWHRGGCAGT